MRSVLVSVLLLVILISTRTGLAQGPTEPVELEQVVVTATRQPEERSRIPAQVTVITQEDINRSNASHIGDLLRSEAGLWVVNTSGSSPTGIFIDGRGFNNGGGNGSRILVLIDGRRANLVDTSNPDWAAIPLEAIARIEIVHGSSSALYGDNAVVGVINIITKSGAQTPSLSGTIGAGSYDSWNRSAGLSGSDDSLSYYLYGGYETTDGYRENSDYRASNYVGNFRYRPGAGTSVQFRTSYLTNDRLLPGSLTAAEIASVGRRGSVADEDRGGNRQSQFDLVLESTPDPARWYEIGGGQTLRTSGTRITIPGAGFTDIDSDVRSSALSAKYRVDHKAGEVPVRLTLGSDLLKERVTADSFNNYPDPFFPFVNSQTTIYERRLIGAYLHEEITLQPAVILTLAGRLDWSSFQFSRSETDLILGFSSDSTGEKGFRIWSPKAGITYRLSPTTSLYSSWSRSSRFPNRDELTGFFGFTPELDPERIRTVELGGNFNIPPSTEGGLTVFRMQVLDEILFIPPALGTFEFGENRNVPEVWHEGVEVSSVIRYSKSARLKGTYTLTRTKIMEGPFEGGRLPLSPKHTGSATIEMGQTPGILFSVTSRMVGRRILVNDLANIQEKLPGYAVVDAKVSYTADAGEFFIGVNNILDKEYMDFGGVGGFPFGDRIGFNPAPERNYSGGVTVRF